MGRQKDKLDNLLREYYKAAYKSEKDDMSIADKRMMFCEDAAHYNEVSDFDIKPSNIQKMKKPCPKTDLLVEYLAGTLNDNEKNKIDEHIKKCSDCKNKVVTGKELMQKFKENKLENPPKEIIDNPALNLILRKKDRKK